MKYIGAQYAQYVIKNSLTATSAIFLFNTAFVATILAIGRGRFDWRSIQNLKNEVQSVFCKQKVVALRKCDVELVKYYKRTEKTFWVRLIAFWNDAEHLIKGEPTSIMEVKTDELQSFL